jgi:hypothetical protein
MKKDVPLCINFLTKKTPYKGPSADSEEKHEPVSDIDTAAADGLKVLDPKRPIREADIEPSNVRRRQLNKEGRPEAASRAISVAVPTAA